MIVTFAEQILYTNTDPARQAENIKISSERIV